MPKRSSTCADLVVVREPTSPAAGLLELDPPGAGQYWRLRVDLDEVDTKTASHPALPAGTVLLIKDLETQVDGTPHAVHLAAHPDWYENNHDRPWEPDFLYEDFLNLWERAHDAERVRAAEIAALQNDMEATQRAMLSPPPNPHTAGLLAHDPVPNAGGDGRELATGKGLQDMVVHAEAAKSKAEAQVAWITEHTATLGRQTNKLARYHQERAESMLALAQAQIKGLGKIFETVKNLKLYTGESVTVQQVADGEPAPPDARLTVYQDLLSLDEELLIHLDAGGLSHHDVDDLSAVLADQAVADRLIPAPRGLVLCRFRASDKEFFKTAPGASLGEALSNVMANAEENAIAKERRLLYRDGQRFFIVSCAEVFDQIKQLMPSTGEQNDYYHREKKFADRRTDRDDPEYHRITPEDLDYAAAQRRQLGVLNDYARVLVICWGLHDRTDLFSTTSIPKFTNWLDPGFQAARLALVSQDSLVGEERENYAAYRRRTNQMLGPGATVVLDTRAECDHDHAPALFGQPLYNRHRQESERSLVYRPVEPFVFGRVRQQAGKFYVEVKAKSTSWRSERVIAAKWFLKKGDEGVLVLDRVHAPDLTYYLTSRRQRHDYARYVALFQKAREFVAARDREEAPLRDFLRQAVVDGRLMHKPDALEAGLTAAIATWRTARADKGLVFPGQKGWDAARRALLNALHSALASHGPRIAAIATMAKAQGRTPLRLVHKGNDTWHLYATATESERDPRVGPWPWAADLELAFAADGSPSASAVSPVLLRKKAGEMVIHEWPESATYESLSAPEEMSCASLLAALDLAEHAAGAPLPAMTKVDLVALARDGLSWARRQKGRLVIRPRWYVPVGTAVIGQVNLRRDRKPESGLPKRRNQGVNDDYIDTFSLNKEAPRVLVAGVDAWAYAWVHAKGHVRQEVEELAVSHYGNKELALKRLRESTKESAQFSLMALSVRDFQAMSGHRFGDAGYRIETDNASDLDDKWFFGNPAGQEEKIWRKAFPDGRAVWGRALRTCRITALGPTGATLFPVLKDACDRPTR